MPVHALAVAATVSLLTALPSGQGWSTYTSEEGRYSISLPAQPRMRSEELNSGGRPFLQHTTQVSHSGAVYMAVWADPPINDTAADKQEFMDHAKAALIKAVNGQHISTVPYGDHGIEFTVNMPNAAGARFVRVRMFFMGARSYTLVMMTVAGADHAEDEKRFFGSFKVAPR